MIFLFFFIVTSNYKNSMYLRSFLCEEAKIKQRTPLKKELCEIGQEAIWESRFTSFFFVFRDFMLWAKIITYVITISNGHIQLKIADKINYAHKSFKDIVNKHQMTISTSLNLFFDRNLNISIIRFFDDISSKNGNPKMRNPKPPKIWKF